MVLRLLLGVLTAGVLFSGVSASAADRKFPDTIDPAKRYMFYLHGIYVERQGVHEAYEYYEILDAIEAEGFAVIGEARGLTNIGRYAAGVAKQVQQLLDAGVPSYQITVAGHSKGGMIALTVAALMGKPGINYVAFSACGKAGTEYRGPLNKFIKQDAAKVDGLILVAWAEDDMTAGDCDDALKLGKAKWANKLLSAGKGGNKFFYKPDPEWLTLLYAHARGE